MRAGIKYNTLAAVVISPTHGLGNWLQKHIVTHRIDRRDKRGQAGAGR